MSNVSSVLTIISYLKHIFETIDEPVLIKDKPADGCDDAGQRQLISFARALLAAPKILILDEATSSIDTETEILLQQGLEQLLKGRTSFIIAHRLSTIRNANFIMYIDKGVLGRRVLMRNWLRGKGIITTCICRSMIF